MIRIKAIALLVFMQISFTANKSFGYVPSQLVSQKLSEVHINIASGTYTIEELLKQIENQTDYHLSYVNNINLKQTIIIKTNGKISISNLLDIISHQSNLAFKQVGKTIGIGEKNTNAKVENIQTSVQGTITDENNLPLVGVTITEAGTNSGVVTNVNGEFSFDIANQNTTLVISYIGYKSIEYPVVQGQTVNIQLSPDNTNIDEVVVTALGITREKQQLGYSEITITNETIDNAPSTSISEALTGKVAGLSVMNASGGPVNSQEIKLRGNSSLNFTTNSALIIVDGTPVNTEFVVAGSGSGIPGDAENNPAYGGDDVHVDFGNGLTNINPEDIESITVLKGAGATALYGSRATNGVLILTTKSGKNKKGIGINFSSGIEILKVQKEPDWQYEYGQGTQNKNSEGELYYSFGTSEDGSSTSATSSAWGPKFDGQYYYQYDPELEGQSPKRQLWQAYPNNRSNFWQTGVNYNHNLSLTGNTEKASGRLSITSNKTEWIIPNTGNNRVTVSTKNSFQLHKRIRLNSSVSYTSNASNNIPGTGYNNNSISYFMIFQNPNIDLDWYRPIWEKDGYKTDQIQPFSSYIMNPYLITNEIKNSYKGSAINANVRTTIDITKKLTLMLRSGINTNQNERERCIPYDVSKYANGYFKTQDIYIEELNNDFLLSYKEDGLKAFSLNVSFGGNHMRYRYRRMDAWAKGLVTPDLYKLPNGVEAPSVRTYDKDKVVQSLYALATLGYKDYVFVDVTGRNDWSSTLPVKNASYFYPSVSTSILLSNLFNLPEALNFLKLRASYAGVGNDAEPYNTQKYYSTSDFASSSSLPTTIYNSNFLPEQTKSTEAGIEFNLLKNGLNGDITLYRSKTKNQILTVPVLWETGYNKALLNSGEIENKGVELMLQGKVIKKKGFTWRTSATWSKNLNKILSLPDGLKDEKQIDVGGRAYFIAKVGGSITDIYGYGHVHAPDGQIVYDKETGLPVYADEMTYQGDASSAWQAGFANTFTYKNIKFHILFDGQYGGIIYSQTFHKATEQGKLEHTLAGREEGYVIGDGVVLNEDGTYSPNTTKANVIDYYGKYYRRYNVEANKFDASFIKLREVSIEYTFSNKWLNKIKVQKLSLCLYGRELYCWSEFPIYDPEVGARSGASILPGVEMGQLPSPATYGFKMSVEF